LIAEKIEAEGAVVDLLDYDVRFGQGFLFSPPRPVRAEALQGVEFTKSSEDKNEADTAKANAGGAGRILAQIARAAGRS
jgi:cyclic-di-GMP phosphodiesterase TipF (flagellum assembly factor)